MTTQHTPTPWRYFTDFESVDVMTEAGGHIARMERQHDEGEANATFIVCAANSHTALIEALESVSIYMGDDATDDSPEAREVRSVIRAALKLAKES